MDAKTYEKNDEMAIYEICQGDKQNKKTFVYCHEEVVHGQRQYYEQHEVTDDQTASARHQEMLARQ